jgi:hypothetical protein
MIRSALLLAVLLSSAVVEASITASAGDALNFSDGSCFTKTRNGGVTNICSTTRTWCVSDYITSSGSKNVVVNGFIPNGGSTFTCSSIAVSQTGVLFQSDSSTLNVINQNSNMPAMTVSVQTNGALNVCCNLTPRSRLNTVNY